MKYKVFLFKQWFESELKRHNLSVKDFVGDLCWIRWAWKSAYNIGRKEAIEECATMVEVMERQHFDNIGHPLITKFDPWFAKQIRNLR